MQGHAARFRTAIVSIVAATLAVVLGATFWPASGHDVDASAPGSDVPNNVDAVGFDGWLYANPETGCVEPPPRDLDPPDVVPAEPKPAPDAEGDLREHRAEPGERGRVPLDRDGPNVHVEPWPACDESRTATTVEDGPRDTDD